MRRANLLTLSAVLALAPAALAPASIIQLDFGSNPGLVAPAGATNSPGHATALVPNAATTWNLVTTADIASGLAYADGAPATSVTIDLGHEATSANNVIAFGATQSINGSSLSGSQGAVLGTDYTGAAQDGIFANQGSSSSVNAAIGFRLDGLDAGQYTLFYVGRNTNTNTVRPALFYTAVGALAATFDFSALTPVTLSNANISGNNTWVAGNQYATATIDLAAGQSIFVATEGGSATELRGFLNSVQIVSVPEPATALAAIGALALLASRRRRAGR